MAVKSAIGKGQYGIALRHTNNLYIWIYRHICRNCKYHATSLLVLKIHKQIVHGYDWYACKKCDNEGQHEVALRLTNNLYIGNEEYEQCYPCMWCWIWHRSSQN